MIKFNGEIIEPGYFPDGTMFLHKCLEDKWNKISWFYDSESELIQLIYLVEHIKNIWPTYFNTLYMPYVPNARMDRVTGTMEVFTLKYFCNVINSLGFRHVSILDPHSRVTEALINNVGAEGALEYIQMTLPFIGELPTIFYPDEGAMKRYSLGMPYVFGVKDREWDTGIIKDLSIVGDEALIKDKNILIVDDICSKGGTFYHSAKKLKELGANKIYLYVTHCENTVLKGTFGKEKLNLLDCGLIEKVFTTNSIFTEEHEKVQVFNVGRDNGTNY